MPSQYKLVSVGLCCPPEPDAGHLPSLRLLWPTIDSSSSDTFVGLRCLKMAATNTTPITSPMLTVPSEIAGKIVKIVSPSDPRLAFSLALALLADGSVIYLSSSQRFHLRAVTFATKKATEEEEENKPSPSPPSSAAGEAVSIVDIAAGATHFLACDSSEHAWAWGWGNEWGQFGTGTVWKCAKNSGVGLASEGAGSGASGGSGAASSPSRATVGEVISAALLGQKRLEASAVIVTAPQRLTVFGAANGRVGVAAVAAGRYHSLFLASTRRSVYACGWGERGQLGQGQSVPLTPTPKSIMRLFGCAVAAVAASSGGDHTHLLLESGKVLAFGDNTSGALGTGTKASEWAPSRVAFHTTVSVGLAGIKDLCVANVKNYTAGQAPYGSPESFMYPRRVQQITQSLSPGEPATDVLTTSATHTLLRTSEGQLFSCGQRPVRVIAPLSVLSVDAIGALGRYVALPDEALVLEECTVETGPNAVPIAGQGFTIFMDGTGNGHVVYLVGAIADAKGRVVVASGIKGAPSAGSVAIAFEGLVRNVFPVLGGAIALVQV